MDITDADKERVKSLLENWSILSKTQNITIKDQANEIERLNKRIETLQEVVRDQHAYGVEQLKENDRLREALSAIAISNHKDVPEGINTEMMWFGCVKIARDALEQKDNPQ